MPSSFEGVRDPATVEDDIDDSLIGQPLLAKIDLHRGDIVTSSRSFPGFGMWTWEREPGTMELYGIIGHQRTFANEIQVQAGRQYVGIYDPNNRTFLVQLSR